MSCRYYTIACMMLEAGLRVGEALSLKWSDAFFDSKSLSTLCVSNEISKSKVSRDIPISSRLTNALETYRINFEVEEGLEAKAFLFYSRSVFRPITSRSVERAFEKFSMRSIGRKVWPHMLRHTFATRLMKRTDARTVQILLGHKHLSSTQIYTHPSQDDMRSAIEALST